MAGSVPRGVGGQSRARGSRLHRPPVTLSASLGGEAAWKGTSNAGTPGSNAGTVPARQSQGDVNAQPRRAPHSPFSPVIPVITAALFAGWEDRPSLLQSMPTALLGAGPSHGRSHERACTRRHGHVIPPGHARCLSVAVWAGRRKAAEPGLADAAPQPSPIRMRGRGNRLSGGDKKPQISFIQQKIYLLSCCCCSLLERVKFVGLEGRN